MATKNAQLNKIKINTTRLIELFGVSVKNDNTSEFVDFFDLNVKAIKSGYFIHPDICNKDTLAFVKAQKVNHNSTFYKDWTDVVSKNRFEIFLDQFRHYASTYGTGFSQAGNGYVPNDGDESEVPDVTKYKIILPCTKEEMFEKCMTMICSGIAIDSNDVEVLCDYIYVNRGLGIDVNNIKNREAQVILCDRLGQYPTDKFALLKFIVYKTTGQSMIIQNVDTVSKIENSKTPFIFSKLTDEQLTSLSSIFLRYKNIFLAFKHTSKGNNRPYINRLRRLAAKNHRPMKTGLWERVLTDETALEEARERVGELTNFKIVALMQAIRENLWKCDESLKGMCSKSMYVVRNGKVWIKDNSEAVSRTPDSKMIYWSRLYDILKETLVRNLSGKATTVKFPVDCVLTCPTSTKNFVGNLPMGSYYDMETSNYFGIYWKEDWGTQDFDLSFISEFGEKIGWNCEWRSSDDNVIFSGDMTSAKPEATEVMYCGNKMPDGVIKVNRYCGEVGSTFKLFFGSEKINRKSFNSGYMVDPNTVKMTTMVTSQDLEQMVGLVHDGRAYVLNVRTGNRRVSYGGPEDMFKVFVRKAQCFVRLKDILLEAGFTEWAEDLRTVDDEPVEVGLDLTCLNKDTLISLFAK